jgi:hypothetical protein
MKSKKWMAETKAFTAFKKFGTVKFQHTKGWGFVIFRGAEIWFHSNHFTFQPGDLVDVSIKKIKKGPRRGQNKASICPPNPSFRHPEPCRYITKWVRRTIHMPVSMKWHVVGWDSGCINDQLDASNKALSCDYLITFKHEIWGTRRWSREYLAELDYEKKRLRNMHNFKFKHEYVVESKVKLDSPWDTGDYPY